MFEQPKHPAVVAWIVGASMSHLVDTRSGNWWIKFPLGRLYGRIYHILLAVDNSSPAIYAIVPLNIKYRICPRLLNQPQSKKRVINIHTCYSSMTYNL